MTTFQTTVLVLLLWTMKPDHHTALEALPTNVDESKILQVEKGLTASGAQGNKLPIPDFEDFRPFLETSGVVGRSEWSKYPIQSETGLYGFYTLFTEERAYLGELIVHYPRSINHWRMDDPNQTFIRAVIEGEGIEVVPGLTIGLTKEELYRIMGRPVHQSQDCAVYMDQSGTYLKVDLIKEKVIKLDYGLYTKTYLDSIRSRTGECG